MKISYLKTKYFNIKILYENQVLKGLDFVESIPDTFNEDDFSKEVFKQILEYLNGDRKVFNISCFLNGTVFQTKVWNALKEIPYGQVRTYKQIAESVNSPKAFRAVGNANNKNPIPIIIPCHRVIGSNGNLVGYAHGTDIKKILLNLEKIEVL